MSNHKKEEERPVIVIRKGKRKINPLLQELFKNVPQETKDMVEKAMTCEHLTNGDDCKLGGHCYPKGCEKWKYAEWLKEKEQNNGQESKI